MKAILAISLLLGLCCASCTIPNYPLSPHAIYTESGGNRLCKVHRTPIIDAEGFQMAPPIPMVVLTDEYIEAAELYPNHITYSLSLTQTEKLSMPCKFQYCEQCESAFHSHLSNSN
jgi:hypothetical protein